MKLLVKWLSTWHQWEKYWTRLNKMQYTSQYTVDKWVPSTMQLLYILYIYVVWGWEKVKHNPFVNCYMISAKHSARYGSELEIEATLKCRVQVGWYGHGKRLLSYWNWNQKLQSLIFDPCSFLLNLYRKLLGRQLKYKQINSYPSGTKARFIYSMALTNLYQANR